MSYGEYRNQKRRDPLEGGRRRTHTCGRPGVGVRGQDALNQFERLWSRPSESPINFMTMFSMHNLHLESSPLASAWLQHQSLFDSNNTL